MKAGHRTVAIAAAALAAGCAPAPRTGPAAAVRWLLAGQQADGSFRSDRYGVLRAGHSTTALAVLALTWAPRAQYRAVAPAIARGLDFLEAHGVVPTTTDAIVDYPNYTAACWLWTLARVRPRGHEASRDMLVAFLGSRQLTEDAGWEESDAAYGGFDFGAVVGAKPRGSETVNLSTTAWVIEACRAANVEPDDPLLRRARAFVLRCQVWAPDDPDRHGGFVHSPVPGLLQSKAGQADGGDPRPLPYASTTCDGLLALDALGERGTPQGAAAAAWLVAHARVPEVGGFERSAERWQVHEPALRVYALSALARARPLLPEGTVSVAAIDAAWQSRQQPDGSIAGWSDLMKEDDPLVATALALRGWPEQR